MAPNGFSIAQAYFEPKAWFRAIYAGEAPFRFVMIHDDGEKGEYFLWRLMIDAEQQGVGFRRSRRDQSVARSVRRAVLVCLILNVLVLPFSVGAMSM